MATETAAVEAPLATGSARPPLGSATKPTFITTTSCPYAQRSWIALNEKGVEYEPVFVDLKNKPEWFFPLNPYGRVPTLAWQEGGEDRSLYESLVVNEYVEDGFEGPSLLPANPVARARARLLIDQFGAKFSPAFGRVMFATDAPEAAAAASALDEAIRWLDGALDPSGPYACGDAFTLADCALAPFAIRLGVLGPLCGYEPPAGAARVAAWREACLARPSVRASMVPSDPQAYLDKMLDTYKSYVADRKAAAAAAKK